jgi:DNA polymerase I-like protein with 3'-5' exonuclease and polymerase domains
MAKLEYRLYTDWQDVQVLEKSASKEIALDVETTGLDPFKDQLRLIQVYFPHSNEVAILDVWEMDEPKKRWLNRLFDVLEDSNVVKYLQNSLFDLLWFRCYGLQVRNVRDVKVLSSLNKAGQYEAYLYYAGISTPNSLEWLSQEFGYEHDKSDQKSDWSGKLTESQLNYAARDVVVTYHIGRRLYETLSTYQPDVVDAEMRCLAAFNELNFQGLPVGDPAILDKVCALYRKAADSARGSLSRLLNEDPVQKKKIDAYYKSPLIGKSGKPIKVPKAKPFNVDSAAQVREYLVATFGKDAIEKYDTSSGRYKESTGKDVLFDLYSSHPEATELKELLYYRGVAKAASTLESYRNSYDSNRECLKVIYQSLATQGTGRSSSGDKRRKDLQNAQNIAKHLPSHQYYHLPPIRSIISARQGYVLFEVDLAASHLQFARVLSKDPSMQEAKESGIKLHYFTLSSMLKLDGLTVTPEECIALVKGRADKSKKEHYEFLYKCSKTVIYSFLNYAGAKRLQQSFRSYETNVSLEDCQRFLEACARQYWKLREFQDTVYRRACATIQSVYTYNRLTGEQIYLGKLGYSITCDGAKVWHRAEQYDRYDRLKISDVVAAQWLRPEATVMKNALATIHDRCIEEWGIDNARLVNFSHDSLMVEIREELVSEIAPKICDIVNDCMRIYIPDYEPEETWEEQVLKHNWAKYDCQHLKVVV